MPRAVSYTLALLALGFVGYFALFYIEPSDAKDLRIYFDTAERLRQGLPLYDARYSFADRGSDFELQYLYPPALAALLAPLVPLSADVVFLIWQAGIVASLVAAALMLARFIRTLNPVKPSPEASLLFLLLALWPPTLDGILWGQVNAYILVLLIGVVYATARSALRSAGFLLGIAIAIKATPAILVIPLLVNKQWRALLWTALGIMTAHLPLCLYPHGLQAVPDFIRTTGEIAVGDVVNDPFYDYSLRRVVTFFVDVPSVVFTGLAAVVSVAYLAVVAAYVRASLNSNDHAGPLRGLELLLGIPVMIIISPLVWNHHLIWLFPVLMTLIFAASSTTTALCGRLMYVGLAPLLYVHVFIRNNLHYGESLVKPLPLLVSCLAAALLIAVMGQISCARERQTPTSWRTKAQ
jgi:hypothetical protein